MEQRIKSIVITLELAQDLITYLAAKPYSESAAFIVALQKSEKVYEPILENTNYEAIN